MSLESSVVFYLPDSQSKPWEGLIRAILPLSTQTKSLLEFLPLVFIFSSDLGLAEVCLSTMYMPSVAFLRPTETLVSSSFPTPTAYMAEPQQQAPNARDPEWLDQLSWCHTVLPGLGTFPIPPISQRMGCWLSQVKEKIQEP